MRIAGLVSALLLTACGGDEAVGISVAERARQAASAADTVSARILSEADLPPEGTRSLFDHLLAQNDGLPYPFEKLIKLIQDQHPQAQAPVSLMIPLGRSLLKASADFSKPRVLVAADFHAPNTETAFGFAPRGQLFLGFVEQANEIEVVSYNEAAGRYEFQLVQNYCEGCVPRIVYAKRAICTTCHQGGTPIFPQRPWSETNAQPEIAAEIVAARGADPYLALPVVNALSAPERFDELTDTGAFRVAAQRAWLDGCGSAFDASTARGAAQRPAKDGRAGVANAARGIAMEGEHNGNECRRQMLKVALKFGLEPGGFDAAGADAQKLRSLQTGTVSVPESDVRNRDPLAERRGFKGLFRQLFSRKSAEPGAKDNEDLEAFDRLPKLPADLDPVAPRPPKKTLTPDDLEGAFALAQFFTESDFKRLDAAAGYRWSNLSARVDQVPDDFFKPAPFARVKTLQALLGQSQYCCLDVSEMSPPQAAGGPPLALADDSPLKSYEAYCFACHRGNPAKRLSFMDGASEDEVLASIKEKSEIRDALDWERYRGTDKAATLMPPTDSHQYKAMTRELAQNPKLLDDMRKQVPALFDF